MRFGLVAGVIEEEPAELGQDPSTPWYRRSDIAMKLILLAVAVVVGLFFLMEMLTEEPILGFRVIRMDIKP
jgi:predicted secreted protein